jgi:hypothetical protein
MWGRHADAPVDRTKSGYTRAVGDPRHHGVPPDVARSGDHGAEPGSARAGTGRHRRRRPHRGLLLATVLVLLGGTLGLLAAGDRWLFAGGSSPSSSASPSPSSSAPSSGGTAAPRSPALTAPAVTGTPAQRLDATTAAVTDALAGDAGALGPAGDGLLASLRQVQAAGGPARRLAAVVVSDSVTAAVAAGQLEEGAGRQVLDTLTEVARPERLIDLVQTVETGPLAIGAAGPELHRALHALDHEVPSGRTAARAAELLEAVTTAADDGRVSEAFRAVAAPVLERLADPAAHEDLQALLAAAERDPARVGPAAPRVLAALRAAAGQPVYPRGNTALDLLALLRQDGQVTSGFREEAVPVVEALVR